MAEQRNIGKQGAQHHPAQGAADHTNLSTVNQIGLLPNAGFVQTAPRWAAASQVMDVALFNARQQQIIGGLLGGGDVGENEIHSASHDHLSVSVMRKYELWKAAAGRCCARRKRLSTNAVFSFPGAKSTRQQAKKQRCPGNTRHAARMCRTPFGAPFRPFLPQTPRQCLSFACLTALSPQGDGAPLQLVTIPCLRTCTRRVERLSLYPAISHLNISNSMKGNDHEKDPASFRRLRCPT